MALVVVVAAATALTAPKGLDYSNPPPGCAFTIATCDDPGPAIGALSDLHLSDFFQAQPFMGPLTLAARAPVVAVAEAAGANVKQQYRWGAFVCLLVVGAFGVWLVRQSRWPFWVQAVAAAGAVWNPVTKATLLWGHPEELVTAAFTVIALVLAIRGRARAAGLSLGLAVAAKAWAVLALPALLVIRRGWRPALVACVVTVAVFTIPMAIGAPNKFHQNVTQVGKLGSQIGTLTPTNAVWPLGEVVTVQTTQGAGQAAHLPLATARIARALIFAIAILLALAWVRLGGRAHPETVLLLVALTLLLRSLLDPSNHSYYHAGPLLSLFGYEVFARRAFPFASAAFLLVIEATNRLAKHVHGFDGLNRLYLAWAVPFAIYMAWELLSRTHGARAPQHRETRLPAGTAGL